MTISTFPGSTAPRAVAAAPGTTTEQDSTPPSEPDAGTTTSRRRGPRAGRTVALVALLAGTAVLYLWSLSASGYGNSFYAAAVQAGSQSWKAFFFGSLDAGNAITVDKPPASLWLMALSVRIFGLSSWSILAPQALLGVATVGVTYASVRRTFERSGSLGEIADGHRAGLVAGALLALTPAAALMFRFDNPDALLVFLMTLAAYVTLRAAEKASGKTLAWAGVLIGFAFLTKMLQAFLVLPALVLVYLVAAPTTLKKRLLHLVGAFAAMIVSLGWWVAIVELVPASWRPYVGGSTNNSVLDLVFGYNGLARILGRSGAGATGAPGGGGGGGGFGGTPGLGRLFEQVSAGMITWLLPAALLLALVAVVAIGRAPRTDGRRAALILWTGWTVVTALTFSLMEGTYHDYYVVALAPAIAAGVAVGGTVLWNRKHTWLGRAGLALAVAGSAVWAFVLLGRATGVYESLRWPVLVVGVIAALGLLVAHRLPRLAANVVLAVALAGAATGPAAYALNTVATPHTGSIVTAGPVTSQNGPGGGTRGGFGQGQAGRDGRTFPGGGTPPQGQTGQAPGQGQTGPGQTGRAQGGGMGQGGAASTELVQLLQADAGSYRWAAATIGSQSAATYQLASEQPVMAIGGFTGSDPSPTLAQFQAYVAAGDVHYFIGGGGMGGGRGGGSSEISTWVTQHYTATTVGGATVYDLTQPTS
ncbi:ArnT family glycosyltransferase [Microlunatus antarcticus]|uniref:4-amino-4-deoxy-L-arabinose transferase-like glycosyltransferase n=1 Tax=Microlunatus antarcticus TaxID=53388 RepID=A0A7W5JZC8_9ACTN|nr:glycosyltransferase family 39 protein [Microlunatus antarcticus]MBB3329131.1 4-amino-4-deoxy-L-arabinose transferase-like glycosyltransferase [Microlunatus antarcticus]